MPQEEVLEVSETARKEPPLDVQLDKPRREVQPGLVQAVEEQERAGAVPLERQGVPEAVVEADARRTVQRGRLAGAQLEPESEAARGQLDEQVVVGSGGQEEQAVGSDGLEAKAEVRAFAGVLQFQGNEAVAQEGRLYANQ